MMAPPQLRAIIEFIAAWRESSGSKIPLVWAMFRGRSSRGDTDASISELLGTYDDVQQAGHQGERDHSKDHDTQSAHLSSFTLPSRERRHSTTLCSPSRRSSRFG